MKKAEHHLVQRCIHMIETLDLPLCKMTCTVEYLGKLFVNLSIQLISFNNLCAHNTRS